MFIVDTHLFKQAMRARGFSSLGALADKLGMHRNTIGHYLSGQAVFSRKFEQILAELRVSPVELLVDRSSKLEPDYAPIASLVDDLHLSFPKISLVWFGSRARAQQKAYSDWDLGAYSMNGITHETFRSMHLHLDNLTENFPFFVDLVNLNQADRPFLKNISRDWHLLSGPQQDWIQLNRELHG